MRRRPDRHSQRLLSDVSRELYADIDKAFAAKYKADTGSDITINQSHAGSSKQARAVLEGLKADVVTFNQVTDVQVLHDRGDLIPADWQSRLPNNASPYLLAPRLPGPRRQPEEHQGLERPRARGREGRLP